MDRGIAVPGIDGGEPGGVERGLAVVDALATVENHEHVVVEVGGVDRRGLLVPAGREEGPGRRGEEAFPGDGGEGALDARVGHPSGAGDLAGVSVAQLVEGGGGGAAGHAKRA
jgi:hypothetical protein